MIKAIVFDCFGVLVGRGFRETYLRAGGDPDKDEAFIGDVLKSAYEGQISSEDMSHKMASKLGISYEAWRSIVTNAEQPKDDLLSFISDLHGSYKTAILSNANVGTLQRKFSVEQLALFDEVVVSAEVGMIKPNPDIYEYTAAKLGVRPEECVFIDDSEGYCIAAGHLGMQAICYRDFSHFKQKLTDILESSS